MTQINLNASSPVVMYATQPRVAAAPGPEPAPLMPESKASELMASGDLGAMIAAMLLETGARSRETARAAKDAALKSEEAACERKLQQMEVEAEKKLLSGLAGAAATGLPGLASVLSVANPKIDSRLFQGGGGLGDSMSKAAGAVWSSEADEAKREIAQAEREMSQAKRAVENASDDEKDAKELLRRALDHYKEFATAKEDAKRAALFRA